MTSNKILPACTILFLASLACNALSPAPESTPTMVVIVEPTFPSQPSNLPMSEADVTRIPLEEALTAYAAGAALFVDVRSQGEFAESHIPDAMNVPISEIESNPVIPGADKNEWIIAYCT